VEESEREQVAAAEEVGWVSELSFIEDREAGSVAKADGKRRRVGCRLVVLRTLIGLEEFGWCGGWEVTGGDEIGRRSRG
jgi:hypothetical protein